jgi:hypothetical protein
MIFTHLAAQREQAVEDAVAVEPRYYVQNIKAGYVGNNPMFWKKNGNGYTSYIDDAEQFTREEARKLVESDADKWLAWPVETVEACDYRTVEGQRLVRCKPAALGITTTTEATERTGDE